MKTGAEETPREAEAGQDGALVGQAEGRRDPVEDALAMALVEAAKAGRFDVVGQLARELEARRLTRSDGKVVPLEEKRRRV